MTFPDDMSLMGTPGSSGLATMTAADRVTAALDFVSDLRYEFEERDKLFEQIDAVTFLEQAVNIPENYKKTAVEVRTPLPRHIINQIVAALSINTPKVHCDPIAFGDEGENDAAYKARFFEMSWLRQQREKRRRIFRLFMDNVVTKGFGVLKTYERKQRAWAKYTPYSQKLLEDLDAKVKRGEMDMDSRTRLWDASTEEMKRKLPYPIESTAVAPGSFYYQQGEDGYVRIAEISAVPYYQTLQKYGAALNEKGEVVAFDDVVGGAMPVDQWGQVYGKRGLKTRTIERVEYWDVDRCMIILRGPGDIPSKNMRRAGAGLMVREWLHNYGDHDLGVLRGPYFTASGILTSSPEPHKANLSVLYAYLHLFPLLNSLLTMQSQAAFSTAYPAFRRTSPPDYGIPNSPFGQTAEDILGGREKVVPGAIFPHDIAPMDQPHTSIDLDKAIQFVKSLIDLALPDTVQGAVSGEMAGYALNQAAHMASLTWGPIVDNVEDCLSDRVGWESRLIDEHIGEPVYVWGQDLTRRKVNGSRQAKAGWMGIGPKDLDGVHRYDVTLEPATINNDQLELRVIKDELDMRLMDPAEAIRRRGRNPVDVERAWLLYELKQDDQIRNMMRQYVFRELGTIEQQSMTQLGPEGSPQAPVSGMPPGAQPGVSQGLPTTGFVQPAGSVAPALPPGQGAARPAGPIVTNQPPGPVPGSPGGARGVPAAHEELPGGG